MTRVLDFRSPEGMKMLGFACLLTSLVASPHMIALPAQAVVPDTQVAVAIVTPAATPLQCRLWRLINKPKYRKYCL